MLFWSFVLAFVLSILYYMSPVHNVTQVENKPLSDTMVATFVNAHQAAKRLTYIDTAKTICVKVDDKGEVEKDSNGLPIKKPCILKDDGTIDKEKNFEVEDTSERTITFTYQQAMKNANNYSSCTSGDKRPECIFYEVQNGGDSRGGLAIINPDEIKKMLPGLIVNKDRKTEDIFQKYVDDYGLTSAFACITNVGTDGTTIQPYLTFDCQGGKNGGIGDYVITYMQAPSDEYSTIARNELWRSGILRRTKGSHECGVLWKTNNIDDEPYMNVNSYAYKDNNLIEGNVRISLGTHKKYDKKSPYIMDNSRRFTLSVPTLIGKVIEESPDNVDADGNGKKDITEDMESGYLLFCITPMEDIYRSFKFRCEKGYNHYKTIIYNGTVLENCKEKK